MLEQAKEILNYHKEKCFRCGTPVERGNDGLLVCDKCGFKWANLFIKRLPADAFLLFKQYADDEYCADYGMALKSLLMNRGDWKAILEMLQDLNVRMTELERKPEEKVKIIRTVNGKEIKIGGIEK